MHIMHKINALLNPSVTYERSYIYDVDTTSFDEKSEYRLPNEGEIGFVEFKGELYHYRAGTRSTMYKYACLKKRSFIDIPMRFFLNV